MLWKKSGGKILELYRQLQVQAKSLGTLTNSEFKKMFPDSFGENILKASKALGDYSKRSRAKQQAEIQKESNRYGIDYQSRIQFESKLFDLYLVKSIYRVDFYFNNILTAGSFEKYKQDETQTLHYLLTKTDVSIPNGTILMIPDKDKVEKPWMVYYLRTDKG